MRSPAKFLLFVFALVAIAHTSLALSIQGGSAGLVTRENTVDVPSKAVLDVKAEDKAVMAPHDVELVRRASWTYSNGGKRST